MMMMEAASPSPLEHPGPRPVARGPSGRGCVKALSVNGQPLNLQTSFLTSAGILASCPISGTLCRTHDCGAGQCTEVSWRPVCVCPGGVT